MKAMNTHQQQRLRAISSSTHSNHVDRANTSPNRRTKANLASLPTELQLAISNLLIYPDALSLKHTSRAFYQLVDTGVELKIDWLVSRRKLHLECPNDRALVYSECLFGSLVGLLMGCGVKITAESVYNLFAELGSICALFPLNAFDVCV
ncbi:hypothetical protein E4U53_007859 [Claviceps sorghi]|nr:hypothetical protein E4U53_007859 [Claviceps sorghi]